MLKKLPKFSSPKVLKYVKSHPCLKCGAAASDPHHLPSPFGGSRRALDIAIPLCRLCHGWVHANPLEEQDKLDSFYAWALLAWVRSHDVSWECVWSAVVEDSLSKK